MIRIKFLKALKKYYVSKLNKLDSKIYGIHTFSETIGMDYEEKCSALQKYESIRGKYLEKYNNVSLKIKSLKRRR